MMLLFIKSKKNAHPVLREQIPTEAGAARRDQDGASVHSISQSKQSIKQLIKKNDLTLQGKRASQPSYKDAGATCEGMAEPSIR